jgi:putative ABC transport system substrate-binding protein
LRRNGFSFVDAVVVLADFLTFGHAAQLNDLAARHSLPMISELEDFATAGAIMAYGPSLPDLVMRTGDYIDRILKGARPADLPVEGPTTFRFIVNVKTARALGISVPATLALRADRIIE